MSNLNTIDELAREKNEMHEQVIKLQESYDKLLVENKTLKCELELLSTALKGVLKTFDKDQLIGELINKT